MKNNIFSIYFNNKKLKLISETKKEILCIYKENYKDYKFVKEHKLKIKNDPTLEFSNCTITTAKSAWINNKKNKDYIVFQNCLRTNTFLYHEDSSKFKWNSELFMIGGFSYNGSMQEHFEKQLFFLKKIFSAKRFSLKITIHWIFKENNKIDLKKNYGKNTSLFIDKSSNLEWKYGYSNFLGLGTRWEIVDIKNNKVYNFGNVIEIMDENKKTIGFDFGGGLEILVQAKLNEEFKISCCKSFPNIIFKEINILDNFVLIDCLITIFTMLMYSKNLNFIILLKYNLYMYYKSMFKLIQKWQIDKNDLNLYLKKFFSNNIKNMVFSKFEKKFYLFYDYYYVVFLTKHN